MWKAKKPAVYTDAMPQMRTPIVIHMGKRFGHDSTATPLEQNQVFQTTSPYRS
jgi:hypothetical protein